MDNQWEVLKKDENGNKYTIHVKLSGNRLVINEVGLTPKGKRKVTFIGNVFDNKYRGYAVKDRGQAAKDDILASVPNHLLQEALNDIWKTLKPEEIVIK